MLPPRRHFEIGEDQNENENVIYAKTEFYQVGGQELLGEFRSTGEPHDSVEHHGQREPDATPRERLLHFHLVRIALKNSEVDRQHRGDEDEEADPSPDWHGPYK